LRVTQRDRGCTAILFGMFVFACGEGANDDTAGGGTPAPADTGPGRLARRPGRGPRGRWPGRWPARRAHLRPHPRGPPRPAGVPGARRAVRRRLGVAEPAHGAGGAVRRPPGPRSRPRCTSRRSRSRRRSTTACAVARSVLCHRRRGCGPPRRVLRRGRAGQRRPGRAGARARRRLAGGLRRVAHLRRRGRGVRGGADARACPTVTTRTAALDADYAAPSAPPPEQADDLPAGGRASPGSACARPSPRRWVTPRRPRRITDLSPADLAGSVQREYSLQHRGRAARALRPAGRQTRRRSCG
jgi:hypothetical protein